MIMLYVVMGYVRFICTYIAIFVPFSMQTLLFVRLFLSSFYLKKIKISFLLIEPTNTPHDY